MGLRTAQQYLQGLRDGRYVTFKGERVEDVTTHEHLGVGARHTAVTSSDRKTRKICSTAVR